MCRGAFFLIVLAPLGHACSGGYGPQPSGIGGWYSDRRHGGHAGRRAPARAAIRPRVAALRDGRGRGHGWRRRHGRNDGQRRHGRHAVADRAARLRRHRRRADDPARVRDVLATKTLIERQPERRNAGHRGDPGGDHRLPGRPGRAPRDRRRQDGVRLGGADAEVRRQLWLDTGHDAVRVARSARLRLRRRQVRRQRHRQLVVQAPDQRHRPDGLGRRRRRHHRRARRRAR